ncbi:MAG: Ig-like domain-containing protein, partial [Clostridia bacterium]|nr:Ig-like domain-containing protein [Clostridia bacterium]
MKKLLSVVIAICMMLVAFGTVSYADVNAITPEICVWGDTTVGNEIVVSVSIPAYTGAAGGSLNLVYDNTRMAVIDATAGEILGGYSVIVNKTYAANKVRMTFSGSSVVSAYGGEILNVTFALLEAGSAEISTENMKLADINSTKLTCTNSDMSVAIIEEDTSVHVTGIRLNKTNITLEQGDTATLIATVLPTNATNKTVFWESSDSSVAEVTEDGVIYAINPGTAYISVITDDGGYTKGCTVIVTEQIIIYDNPTISISDIKTRPGKSIDVSVELSNNTGFANLVMQVGYDKDILTLVGVEPNESVTEFTPAENYNVYPYNMAW